MTYFSDSVNGKGVLHRKLAPGDRACLVADILDGIVEFKPSQGQLCTIFGVSPATVREMRVRYGNGSGSANGNGDAAANGNSASVPKAAPTEPVELPVELIEWEKALSALVHAWHSAGSEVREAFVREVGVDAVWDVIARLIR
jgi:hypothetical protein